jgi:acetylornithine/succinyldiaminopimelate/putrescine aminotransferase
LKFARRYWHSQGATHRTKFVAFDHAFAGRTLGSLSVTWDDHYRAPFAPLLPGVTFVSASDPEALRKAVTHETAAIIVEPIQGEGGVRPLDRHMVTAIEDVCESTGTLLIADEVQSGMGRTGAPFYSRVLGLTPDLVSVGKALGSGVPVGAAVISGRVAQQVAAGDHGSTYGGNLLACRAALVVLDELDNGLLDQVSQVGAHMETRLHELARRHAVIREVRGKGLMWGLDLAEEAAPVVGAARDLGLLVNATSRTVLRMLPPLVVEPAHVDEAVLVLDQALRKAFAGAQS